MIFNTRSRASAVAHALRDRAEEVATALLGDPTSKTAHELRWGARGSRSLRRTGPKRGLWCDHELQEGGDMLDLVKRERNVSLPEAIDIAEAEFLGVHGPARRAPWEVERSEAEATRDDDVARIAKAQRLWQQATSIRGSLGERYFREHRHLEVTQLEIDHALRWHGGIRAVIALMTDPMSAAPLGIHRTFLGPDGAKLERKMLGPQGVVRLSPDVAVTIGLGISEGIEDGIAVMLSAWQPVWAATSAGAISKLPVLAGVHALTIFADADEAGLGAAETCRDRWRAAGREAVIAAPRRASI
jgi:putative DNA primase/helicase